MYGAMGTPALAQLSARPKVPVSSPTGYDVRKEVTIEGTVTSVVTKPSAGMLAGAHVILASSSGPIDVHLGNAATNVSRGLSYTSGERLRIVGVMTTAYGRSVFLARTIQAGSRVQVIRNERGLPVRLGPAGPLGRAKAENGRQP